MVERRTVEHIYVSTACVCQCHAPESGRERSLPLLPEVDARCNGIGCGCLASEDGNS